MMRSGRSLVVHQVRTNHQQCRFAHQAPRVAQNHAKNTNNNLLLGLLGATTCLGGAWAWKKHAPMFGSLQAKSLPTVGKRKDDLKEYSNSDVAKHDSMDKSVWVTYKEGVYDITAFVPKHPGAKNILMAAGSGIEPFWETYAVHKDNAQVFLMLEEYRIGNLSPADVKRNAAVYAQGAPDPYGNEPARNPALKPSSLKPFNAEPPTSALADSFLTPNELFYVRNHLPTPDLNAKEYELEIEGIPGFKEAKVLKLDFLKKFPKVSVTAAIQCGGNRRSEMNAVRNLKGLNWEGGAIGNATWSGARLSDVLEAAGVNLKKIEADGKLKHVQFEGFDLGADGSPYGASVPLEKAVNPYQDVILAYEMNGETLPRDHGYPIRVIVPGVVGARNVKWLNRIVLSEEESDSHWQKADYKGFNPSVTWDNVDWDKSPAIQAMPVTSAICTPQTEVVSNSKLKLKGYAWSGGGNRIIRVDLTSDGGKTWFEAKITAQDSAPEPHHYGWSLWEAEVQVPKGVSEFTVAAKAVDSNYNVQPESFENIWNLRGLLSNAYSRKTFKVKKNA